MVKTRPPRIKKTDSGRFYFVKYGAKHYFSSLKKFDEVLKKVMNAHQKKKHRVKKVVKKKIKKRKRKKTTTKTDPKTISQMETAPPIVNAYASAIQREQVIKQLEIDDAQKKLASTMTEKQKQEKEAKDSERAIMLLYGTDAGVVPTIAQIIDTYKEKEDVTLSLDQATEIRTKIRDKYEDDAKLIKTLTDKQIEYNKILEEQEKQIKRNEDLLVDIHTKHRDEGLKNIKNIDEMKKKQKQLEIEQEKTQFELEERKILNDKLKKKQKELELELTERKNITEKEKEKLNKELMDLNNDIVKVEKNIIKSNETLEKQKRLITRLEETAEDFGDIKIDIEQKTKYDKYENKINNAEVKKTIYKESSKEHLINYLKFNKKIDLEKLNEKYDKTDPQYDIEKKKINKFYNFDPNSNTKDLIKKYKFEKDQKFIRYHFNSYPNSKLPNILKKPTDKQHKLYNEEILKEVPKREILNFIENEKNINLTNLKKQYENNEDDPKYIEALKGINEKFNAKGTLLDLIEYYNLGIDEDFIKKYNIKIKQDEKPQEDIILDDETQEDIILDEDEEAPPDLINNSRQEKGKEEADDDDEFFDSNEMFGAGVGERGLSNHEIDNMMNKFSNYVGCWGNDEIKKIQIKPQMAFIINTKPIKITDGHWCGVYIDSKNSKSIEYFDPFAVDPSTRFNKDIIKIVEKLNPDQYLKFKVNRIQVQNINSDNCGWHAMGFILDRMNGKKFIEATKYDAVNGENKAELLKQKFNYI